MPIASGTREAAVSTPPSGKGLQYKTDKIFTDTKLKDLGVKEEFAIRMCGQEVTLTRKIGESEYTTSITTVSYHAYYKVSNKKAKMLEYFEEMCKFADAIKQTIIIGGDFNLPVLDWKEEVENMFPNRVSVALYVGSPRRWDRDKLIDTFAVVQPSNPKHQTKATLKEIIAIYPFPMAGYVGGDEPTTLQDYPLSENHQRWFKYVHFNNKDVKKVKDALIEKNKVDLAKSSQKKKQQDLSQETKEDVNQKKEGLSKETKKNVKERIQTKEESSKEAKKDMKEKIQKEDTKEKKKELSKETER